MSICTRSYLINLIKPIIVYNGDIKLVYQKSNTMVIIVIITNFSPKKKYLFYSKINALVSKDKGYLVYYLVVFGYLVT